MKVVQQLVVGHMNASGKYEDGKYIPTGEVSVHFGTEGDHSLGGPGSSSNSASITLDPSDAAEFSIGDKVSMTIETI